MDVSPTNIRHLTVNPVQYRGVDLEDNGLGAPFVYDRSTKTIHLAPEGYHHQSVIEKVRPQLQGPTYNGYVSGGGVNWYSAPEHGEREAIAKTLTRHLGTPLVDFHDDDPVEEFNLAVQSKRLRKSASKLDWLKERKDWHTNPVARAATRLLEHRYAPHGDDLYPWILREVKRGNIQLPQPYQVEGGWMELVKKEMEYEQRIKELTAASEQWTAEHPGEQYPQELLDEFDGMNDMHDYLASMNEPKVGSGGQSVWQMLHNAQGGQDLRITPGMHPDDTPMEQESLRPEHLKQWEKVLADRAKRRKGVDPSQFSAPDFYKAMNEQWIPEYEHRQRQDNGQVVHRYPNGWTMRRLQNAKEAVQEGEDMGHCVGGYGDYIDNGTSHIFSLRDKRNMPHATLEIRPKNNLTMPTEDVPEHLRNYGSIIVEVAQWLRNGWTPQQALDQLEDDYSSLHPDINTEIVAKAIQVFENSTVTPPELTQVQGKENSDPNDEYKEMIRQWMRQLPPGQRPQSERRAHIRGLDQLMTHTPNEGEYGELTNGDVKYNWHNITSGIQYNPYTAQEIYDRLRHLNAIPELGDYLRQSVGEPAQDPQNAPSAYLQTLGMLHGLVQQHWNPNSLQYEQEPFTGDNRWAEDAPVQPPNPPREAHTIDYPAPTHKHWSTGEPCQCGFHQNRALWSWNQKQAKVANEVEGYTNWDTFSVSVACDNDRKLYQQSRALVQRNATPQQFEQWAIQAVIAPTNKNTMADAQEYNEMPAEEREPDMWGEVNDYNPANHLIDPAIVNWSEIVNDIREELGMLPLDVGRPEWLSKVILCPTCGDPMEDAACKRCDWGAHNLKEDTLGNPSDAVQDLKGPFQSSVVKKSIAILPTFYHVSPAHNRDSIRNHGLIADTGDTSSPWTQDLGQPHGNYLFDNIDDARDYIHVLHGNLHGKSRNEKDVFLGDHPDNFMEHGVYPGEMLESYPEGFDDWPDDQQEEWEDNRATVPFDHNDPEHFHALPDHLKGYDIWAVTPYGGRVKADPESALDEGEIPPGPPGNRYEHALNEAWAMGSDEDERPNDDWRSWEGNDDWDYGGAKQPRRYYVPQTVTPENLQLAQHVPAWQLTSEGFYNRLDNDEDPAMGMETPPDERMIPEEFHRVIQDKELPPWKRPVIPENSGTFSRVIPQHRWAWVPPEATQLSA